MQKFVSGFEGFARVLVTSLMLAAFSAEAASFSYSGNFVEDDDVLFFLIQVDAPTTLTIRTLSFGGGTNEAGSNIAAGGFAPVLTLFSPVAAGQEVIAEDRNGNTPPSCGVRVVDASTNSCWDGYLSLSLSLSGIYTLALTQDANLAQGPDLASGFIQANTGNFTGPLFTGSDGSFLTAFGEQRTSFYALDIVGASGVSQPSEVPEPSTLGLSFISLAACAVVLCKGRNRVFSL